MIKSYSEFINEAYMPNGNYAVTAIADFTLTDLMDNEFVIFNDEQTDEDVKRIFDYFEKSMSKDESSETAINVSMVKDNILFTLQLHGNNNEINNEFKTNLETIVDGIAQNSYCVVELDKNLVNKFIKKHLKKV